MVSTCKFLQTRLDFLVIRGEFIFSGVFRWCVIGLAATIFARSVVFDFYIKAIILYCFGFTLSFFLIGELKVVALKLCLCL